MQTTLPFALFLRQALPCFSRVDRACRHGAGAVMVGARDPDAVFVRQAAMMAGSFSTAIGDDGDVSS